MASGSPSDMCVPSRRRRTDCSQAFLCVESHATVVQPALDAAARRGSHRVEVPEQTE